MVPLRRVKEGGMGGAPGKDDDELEEGTAAWVVLVMMGPVVRKLDVISEGCG